MAALALPITALSVFLTRQEQQREQEGERKKQDSDDFLTKYGMRGGGGGGGEGTTATPNTPTMQHKSPSDDCDILMLGSGWISNFAVPVLVSKGYTLSATTRQPVQGDTFERIAFDYGGGDGDDESDTTLDDQIRALPTARTVVIVFPLRGAKRSARLVDSYTRLKGAAQWIQLGSTGIWGSSGVGETVWIDRHSPPTPTNERFIAEQELLSLSTPSSPTTVLNLAGLYGQERKPSNFLKRLQDKLEIKGSVHFIHGVDAARAILLLHQHFTPGQRWLLTDGRVHDWWAVALDKAEPGSVARAKVNALTKLLGIKALPRPVAHVVPDDVNDRSRKLVRALDSSHFWHHFDEAPLSGTLS